MLDEQEDRIKELHRVKGTPANESEFLIDATNLVIEIRQVLKWMYVYEYFKTGQKDYEGRRNLFLIHRESLDEHCGNLNAKLEVEFDPIFLDPKSIDRSPFYKYKGDCINLKKTLEDFFNNILDYLQEIEQ